MKPFPFSKRTRLISIAVAGGLLLPLGLFNNCSKKTTLSGSLHENSANLGSNSEPTPTPTPPGVVEPAVLKMDFTTNSLNGIVNGASVANLVIMNRASIGTFYNASGVLTTAAAHQPRFDHDPSSCADATATVAGNCPRKPLGLLVEEGRTNRILSSSNLNGAGWVKGANTFVTVNAGLAPDGTQTAQRLQMANIDGTFLELPNSVEIGKTYTMSLFARSDTPGQICFGIKGNSPVCVAYNVTTKWQRFSHTVVAASTSGFFIENSTNANLTMDALVWGIQVEEGPTASSYIPTNGAMVSRLTDWPTINNNSNWINETEGSLAIEWSGQVLTAATEQALFYLSNLAGDQGIMLNRRTSEVGVTAQVHIPGVPDADNRLPTNSSSWASSMIRQNVVSYSSSGVSSTEQAGSTTDAKSKAIASLPRGLAIITLGHAGPGRSLNGYLRKFQFYKKSLPINQISF